MKGVPWAYGSHPSTRLALSFMVKIKILKPFFDLHVPKCNGNKIRLKLFRYIVFLVSIVWMVEDLVKFVYVNHDISTVAVEWVGGEKLEKKSEYEMKEFLKHLPSLRFLIKDRIDRETISNFYQAPLLSIPEVPPKHSC